LGNRWTLRGLLRSAASGKSWNCRLEPDWPTVDIFDIFDPMLSHETVSHRYTFIILRW